MSDAGSVVFANLALLFAVGISAGLARTDKDTAVTDTLATNNLADAGQGIFLGIQTLETGVFGGVCVGVMVYLLHKKFHKIELPQFLGFFGGSRFVPIICSVASILLGVVMFIIWSHFQKIIFGMGDLIEFTGYIGTFIFGFILIMLKRSFD